MRIIYLLAAGLSAAAIATSAPARPGGGGHGPGNGPGLKVGWSNGGGGGGHHAGKAARTRFGIGRIEIERPRRHHRRFDRGDDFNPYAGIGIAGPVGEVDPWGNGYFTDGGGRLSLRGGRPYYDYDRSYPYEFESTARSGEPVRAEAPQRREAPPRCTFENGVRVCRGW